MTQVILNIQGDTYKGIVEHLLEKTPRTESAGFLFVRLEMLSEALLFEDIEWFPVPREGFMELTDCHFALTDKIRAEVIKRAHDLEASIAEFHSHFGPRPAAFSQTDIVGLQEFAPHVLWRLKGKPYLAVVVTHSNFDALVWMPGAQLPQPLDGIVSGEALIKPTQLSSAMYEELMP